eukprot:CAMPEP_0179886322 /NCGR_PEP_ID=MMETSP0982-20121206/30781_1 /TAXON_ID=483367 /ORGANISM="non described non described, Strain CCMP 2436" /LENGTH=125 /DNA_ID=CAMNT_0021782019 /DNA_START=198 /DNA_END=572 /DNA_ORIENTATION=-
MSHAYRLASVSRHQAAARQLLALGCSSGSLVACWLRISSVVGTAALPRLGSRWLALSRDLAYELRLLLKLKLHAITQLLERDLTVGVWDELTLHELLSEPRPQAARVVRADCVAADALLAVRRHA